MQNKTCGECRFLESVQKMGICEKQGMPLCPSELPSCSKFEQKVVTNGEKIWNSGYDAVIIFAKTWMGKFSCWAEAEAWLNAPAEIQLYDAIQNVIKDGVKTAIDIHEAAYAPDINVATKESEGEDE